MASRQWVSNQLAKFILFYYFVFLTVYQGQTFQKIVVGFPWDYQKWCFYFLAVQTFFVSLSAWCWQHGLASSTTRNILLVRAALNYRTTTNSQLKNLNERLGKSFFSHIKFAAVNCCLIFPFFISSVTT